MPAYNTNYWGELEPPTIVLSTKYHKLLGAINTIDTNSIKTEFNMASAQEISFDVYKELDGVECTLWFSIVDLKYIYVYQYQEYFEISVTVDEDDKTVKHVSGKTACESELSQRILRNFECNTETDILRDDYVPTVFYNPEKPNASLLHRVLRDKCPDYSIGHVDSTIANIQRTFSTTESDIYSFLTGDIAEEIGCLFTFNSINRIINVYDLKCNCNKCGHRGEFTEICPKCGSTDIDYGYGTRTGIYISTENFADSISIDGDEGAVKNCFKIEGGDDLMTATVANINPSNSEYIYSFSQAMLDDMPEELVNKITTYSAQYDSLLPQYESLTEQMYENIDRELYLQTEMMPEIIIPETTAAQELSKLNTEITSTTISVQNIQSLSKTSSDLAVNGMAKVIVDARYNTEIISSSLSNVSGGVRTWTGRFKVKSKGLDDDTADGTNDINITITDQNYEQYLYQKIQKTLGKKDAYFESIFSLEDIDEFKTALTYYSLDSLKSFESSYQTCIEVLIENGVTDQNSVFYGVNLYDEMYKPYYDRIVAIQAEMIVRENEILVVHQANEIVTAQRKSIQDQLDFRSWLGEDLWIVFSSYLREDTYTNSNYISDGLSNTELIDKAKELFETAKEEIQKSKELQITLTAKLENLLSTKEFEGYKHLFEVGNWIVCKADDILYRLRLIHIGINYGSLNDIDVTFSNVTKIQSGVSDLESILNSAQSMSSSYDYYAHQASQGDIANTSIRDWIKNGLSSALVNISNNNNEEITYDEHGLSAKSYDDILGDYSDEQLRITHSILAFTEDNWKTASLGLGKHDYVYYNTTAEQFQTATGYGLSAKFVQSAYVYGSQIIGGDIYSQNYSPTLKTGSVFHLNDGTFSLGGEKMVFDGSDLTLKNVTMKWETVNSPTSATGTMYDTIYKIENDISKLDDRIQTFSQPTDPSTDWTTAEEKDKHVSDLWFDTGNNKTYIYTKDGNTYKWVETNDATLMALARSKSTTYLARPTTKDVNGYVYYAGDLWILQSATTLNNVSYVAKTILTALNTRTVFTESDWVPATTKDATDFASDSVITPGEKIQLKYTIIEIDGEYGNIASQAAKYTMSITDYTAAYNALKTYISPILGLPNYTNMTSNSTVTPSEYQRKFTNYYEERQTVESSLEETRQSYADGVLNDWIDDTFSGYQTNIQQQIDGKIETFYQNNAPHFEYKNVPDNAEYNKWLGDFWHDTANQKSYMYYKEQSGSKYNYIWKETDGVPDIVYDRIDGKNTVFVAIPNTQGEDNLCYHKNDIWILETTGTNSNNYPLYTKGDQVIATQDSATYDKNHWVKKDRYTDDTALSTFINGTYTTDKGSIYEQLDKRAQTWYYSESQMNTEVAKWNTTTIKDTHVSDIWYCTSINNNSSYMVGHTYMYSSSYTWEEINGVPQSVFDQIDGKKSIYLSAPVADTDGDGYLYHSGDLWRISSSDQSSSNTTVKNFASKYAIGTLFASSVNRVKTSSFNVADWSEVTTESAEKALSNISDMGNDGKLTPVEKIQIQRRLKEIDDEKAVYEARKNAYLSYTSVTSAWSTYDTKYKSLKNQSSNWALTSGTTTDITDNSFGKYFTEYYSAKESLDSVLEIASKSFATSEAQSAASGVQNNLTVFQQKVQGALSGGNTATEIGTDYVISPKIGGGYLYIKNASDERSVTIDPAHSYSANGYIFKITNASGVTTIGADSDGNAVFTGNVVATSLTLGSGVSISTSNVSGINAYAKTSDLANVATTGRASDISGLAAVATSGSYNSLNDTPNLTVYVQKDGTIGNTPAPGTTGFKLSSAGLLQVSNATIYGTLYSSAGIIGGLKLEANTLTSTQGSYQTQIRSSATGSQYFLSVMQKNTYTQQYTEPNWYVTGEGAMHCRQSVEFGTSATGNYSNFKTYFPIVLGPPSTAGSNTTDAKIYHSTHQVLSFLPNVGATNYYFNMGVIDSQWRFLHGVDTACFLGSSNHRFNSLFSSDGTIQTSDRKQKKDITNVSDKYLQLFDSLKPASYKMINGTSGRTHIGYIAQDIEESMQDIGLTSLDFAGLCKDHKKKTVIDYDNDGIEVGRHEEFVYDENGEIVDNYALRYDEFIALNTAAIQRADKKIAALEQRIVQLESLLSGKEEQ